jgi:hypothetical protein
MDWLGILALLRAVAATTPAEIREVEEGVFDKLFYESMKIKNQ